MYENWELFSSMIWNFIVLLRNSLKLVNFVNSHHTQKIFSLWEFWLCFSCICCWWHFQYFRLSWCTRCSGSIFIDHRSNERFIDASHFGFHASQKILFFSFLSLWHKIILLKCCIFVQVSFLDSKHISKIES